MKYLGQFPTQAGGGGGAHPEKSVIFFPKISTFSKNIHPKQISYTYNLFILYGQT